MLYDLDDDIERYTTMRDELQTEIDAAMEQHAQICRVLAALQGKADVPDGWTPIVVDVTPAFAAAAFTHAKPKLAAVPEPKKPTQATKKNGPVASNDYPAIARWINEAKANGTYSQEAMERHFGAPRTTVKNWLTACRKRGLLTDPPPSNPAGYRSIADVEAASS